MAGVPEKVRYLLWAKSAGRCAFNGCNKLLYRDSHTKIETNFGDVAHVIGAKKGGPRGASSLPLKYRNNIANLMLMCKTHHKLVDDNPDEYPEELLRHFKAVHEARMARLTALVPDQTSLVLIYRGRVGEHTPKIEPRDTYLAMSEEWYPASDLPIELRPSYNETSDADNDFWEVEARNLDQQFRRKVLPYIEEKAQRNHLSVFALASQPLLVKLGMLLSDIFPAEVYQLHREPPTWKWQQDLSDFRYIVEQAKSTHKHVALVIALSASISDQRVRQALDEDDISIWRLTVDEPNNDVMKGKNQLSQFRVELRSLLNAIKTNHGEDIRLHLFPAMPNSVAVEVGRVWQPKADLPMTIYDQNRTLGGFVPTIKIGEFQND